MDERVVWALEERFWLEGTSFYSQALDPACIMAFPEIGLLRGAADVLESLEGVPRWTSVGMENRSVGHASDRIVVIAYVAEGTREGANPYRCFCTSTYRRDRERWLLVQHQQTMARDRP